MSDSEYKMSGPSTVDRLLSFLQTLVHAGILVVLAMILVELKNLTDKEKGLVIQTISNTVEFALRGTTGTTPMAPIYVQSGGGQGTSSSPFYVRMDN